MTKKSLVMTKIRGRVRRGGPPPVARRSGLGWLGAASPLLMMRAERAAFEPQALNVGDQRVREWVAGKRKPLAGIWADIADVAT